MKRPAIFFDRDNTLIVSDGYLGDPDKVVLLDGAADAVAKARSLGFAAVVISNQSGVARGMFGEDAVHAVNKRLDELLASSNAAAVIDRHEFCPYHPEAEVELYRQDSDLRKPRPGMIHSAARKLALDLSRSWVIGDAPRDIEAGKAAGCRTILLRPAGLAPSPAAGEALTVEPDCIVTTLKEAIEFIDSHMMNRPPESRRTPKASYVASAPADPQPAPTRLEQLAELILVELRRRNEQPDYHDFSVSKLLAGITQVVALAVLVLAYVYHQENSVYPLLLLAIFLEALTIALLIMGRQR